MAFPDDLLHQADHLARWDRRRPKQASLRRAVSTAYYALFHLLTSAAVKHWKIEEQRSTLARVFEHGRMKKAATQCNTTNADLKAVAVIFADLQQKRHRADYDNGKDWTRIEVTALIRDTEAAFRKWQAIANQRAAQDFLLSMLVDRK